ncbi:hypothetical protein Pcinc_023506 [Petrolisthes cinctipes]|uniref:Regulatory protein zeste n=1 Tax=Petrolisthes cinctipes TaxID=88211 RepID=A0AAE1KC51_PETCI|nr:hypothetical protein Pcinc_023506 [Petrolisthes cinctipes]
MAYSQQKALPLTQQQLEQLVLLIKDREETVSSVSPYPKVIVKDWKEIAGLFNASNPEQDQRTAKQLKRSWEHIRRKVKADNIAYMKLRRGTLRGPTPSPPNYPQYLEIARSMMTRELIMQEKAMELDGIAQGESSSFLSEFTVPEVELGEDAASPFTDPLALVISSVLAGSQPLPHPPPSDSPGSQPLPHPPPSDSPGSQPLSHPPPSDSPVSEPLFHPPPSDSPGSQPLSHPPSSDSPGSQPLPHPPPSVSPGSNTHPRPPPTVSPASNTIPHPLPSVSPTNNTLPHTPPAVTSVSNTFPFPPLSFSLASHHLPSPSSNSPSISNHKKRKKQNTIEEETLKDLRRKQEEVHELKMRLAAEEHASHMKSEKARLEAYRSMTTCFRAIQSSLGGVQDFISEGITAFKALTNVTSESPE